MIHVFLSIEDIIIVNSLILPWLHKTQLTLCFLFLQHMIVMEDMLKDFLLGEHLLLVGNQVSYGYAETQGTNE